MVGNVVGTVVGVVVFEVVTEVVAVGVGRVIFARVAVGIAVAVAVGAGVAARVVVVLAPHTGSARVMITINAARTVHTRENDEFCVEMGCLLVDILIFMRSSDIFLRLYSTE